jgi:hypothetical protein
MVKNPLVEIGRACKKGALAKTPGTFFEGRFDYRSVLEQRGETFFVSLFRQERLLTKLQIMVGDENQIVAQMTVADPEIVPHTLEECRVINAFEDYLS